MSDYSNHLNINSAWESLVANCVCVWLKLEVMFPTCSSPALFSSVRLQRLFFFSAKVFISNMKHINRYQRTYSVDYGLLIPVTLSFTLVTNTLVLETNVLTTHVQTSALPTHTAPYVATSDFQT